MRLVIVRLTDPRETYTEVRCVECGLGPENGLDETFPQAHAVEFPGHVVTMTQLVTHYVMSGVDPCVFTGQTFTRTETLEGER